MVGNMVISVPIEKYTFSEISNDLAKVRINVYHNSYNPNGSFFEDDCFSNSAESFRNKPICCAYEYDEDGNIVDFKEHNEEEKPIGVIPETNNYTVEEIDNLNWACIDGLIFREYCPEAYELLKDGKKISMEIEVLDGFKGQDNFFHIKQFNLLCITVLGDNWTPAMGNNATIDLFNKTDSESFATKFSSIINRANEIVDKISTEGGKKVKREEIILKYSILNEKIEGYKEIIDNAELSDEDLEKQLFALSQNQLNNAINEALSQQTMIKQYWDGESYEVQKYYFVDVISSESIVIVISNEDYNYYGVSYVLTGDEAELDFANMVRYLIGDWRPYIDGDANTDSDKETEMMDKDQMPMKKPMDGMMDNFTSRMIEKAKKEIDNVKDSFKVEETEEFKSLKIELEKYSSLEKDLNKIKADFTTLNSNYSELESDKASLEEELKDLRQFKANKEIEFKEAQVNDVLAKFTELQSIEGYDEIVKDKFNYTLEELETKLKVFAFDNNVIISKKQKFTKTAEPVNLTVENKITSENLGDWEILAKYIEK